MNIIITGDKAQGKTILLQKIYDHLLQRNTGCCGFISPRIILDKATIGYQVTNLNTNQSKMLCTLTPTDNSFKFKKFWFSYETLVFGNEIIEKGIHENFNYFIIDEFGPLEMLEQGWYPSFNNLLKLNKNLTFSLRKSLKNDFLKRFKQYSFKILDLNDVTNDSYFKNIF